MSPRFSIKIFWNDRRGVTALLFALVIIPVLIVAGIAMDYSNINYRKAEIQNALDGAVLAGARIAGVDNQERLRRAEQFFISTLPQDLIPTVTKKIFELVNNDQAISGRINVALPTLFMGIVGTKIVEVGLMAEAGIADRDSVQLDMVFCIDATNSMQPTIDAVKNNALSLEDNINYELKARGLGKIGGMRVRVMFFRDALWDQGNPNLYEMPIPPTNPTWTPISNQPALRQSKDGEFYELSGIGSERSAFRDFVAAERAAAGNDEAESGFECLNEAVHSKWAVPGTSRRLNDASKIVDVVVPLVVIWTDTNTTEVNPLESQLNPFPLPHPMPGDFAGLAAKWDDKDLIDQDNKLIVFFGNPDNADPVLPPRNLPIEPRWRRIESWRGYNYGGSLVDGGSALAPRIVDALAKLPTFPRLTK